MTTAAVGGVPAYSDVRKRLRPPSKLLMLAEWRSLLELGLGLSSIPALMLAPRGDGHCVLVLPGFLAGDRSTDLLRRYLKALGYDACEWELGRNFGGVYSMREKLRERLRKLYEKTGQKVSIVGWSLGGVYARDLAISMPDMVRYVITLGSPFSHDTTATNANALYETLSGESVHDMVREDREAMAGELPVPTTSIFTKTDGIVAWQTCLTHESDKAENIEVFASHIGLGVNPAVLWAIADRLAQPAGTFRPFMRYGPFLLGYPLPWSSVSQAV